MIISILLKNYRILKDNELYFWENFSNAIHDNPPHPLKWQKIMSLGIAPKLGAKSKNALLKARYKLK